MNTNNNNRANLTGIEHVLNDNNMDDGPVAEEFRPRIKPGQYRAICYKVEAGRGWGFRPTLYFKFRICEGKHDGLELFMPCPYPKKINYRHKYYKQWMLANWGLPPKGKQLSKKIFPNRMYRILVIDTKRRHDDGTKLPDFGQYSVISSIIEPLTGNAPDE